MASNISSHAVQAFRRFWMTLPHGDVALTVMKAHLLLEEQLRALVAHRMARPEALGNARLSCHAVICLAEALTGDALRPQSWEAMQRLNVLRNDLAHKLEPKHIAERMQAIAKLVGGSMPAVDGGDTKADRTEQHFDFAIWMLFTSVSVLVDKADAPQPDGGRDGG